MNENDLKTEPTGLNGSFDAQGIAVGVNPPNTELNVPKSSLDTKQNSVMPLNSGLKHIAGLEKETRSDQNPTSVGRQLTTQAAPNSSAHSPGLDEPAVVHHEALDVQENPNLLYRNWSKLSTALVKRNFWAALSLALAAFPLTLSFTLAINERMPAQGLTYSSSILTLTWGSLSSLFYSSGRILFRAFTSILFPIVSSAAELYGEEGLAGVVLCSCVLMSVCSAFNLFRYVRYIPSSVLDSIKIGTGLFIVVEEAYSLSGLRSKKNDVALLGFAAEVFTRFDDIHFGELSLGLAVGLAGYKLHKKYKQVPVSFFIFTIGVIYGLFSYSATSKSRLVLLRDQAPAEFKIDDSDLFDGINFRFFWSGLRGLRHIGVYFYSAAMVMLTVIEVCIGISINEDAFGKKVKRKREFLSLSVANCVSWICGWFPLSTPICRIQFTINCGANHKIFHLMNVLLLLFLYLFCFELTGYMPICLMKATNIMISLNLVEPWVIRTYAHYSPKTAVGMWAMVAAMLLVDVAICIPLFLVVFYAILWYYVKKEDVEFVEHGTDTLRIVLKGRLAFTNTGKITEKAAASKRDKVILDFSKCIATEVNFLRNYREVVVLLQTTYKAWFKIEGLEPKLLREAIESGALDASQVGFPAEPEAAQPSSGTPQSGTSHTAIKQPATKGKNAVVGKIPYLRRYLRA